MRATRVAPPFDALDDVVDRLGAGQHVVGAEALDVATSLGQVMVDPLACLHDHMADVPQSYGCPVDGSVAGGDIDHEPVDVVVGCRTDRGVVDLEEERVCEPAEGLVAVDEGVVVDDRIEESGCFGPQVGVGILAEQGRLRAGDSRAQQSDVTDGSEAGPCAGSRCNGHGQQPVRQSP